MSRPDHVKLIGVCPRCGESIELVMSKREIKMLYKGFKRPVLEAQLQVEKELESKSDERR